MQGNQLMQKAVTMTKSKKQKLEEAGFVETTVQEFLGLNEAETQLVELKVTLAKALRDRRIHDLRLSQQRLAERIGSSQSRVAKMEAGDPSVSMDLLMHALVCSGSTASDIGRMIAKVA